MKIQIYKDGSDEFRWRIVSKGKTVADSGEGYKRKATLKKSLESLIDGIGTADEEDLTEA